MQEYVAAADPDRHQRAIAAALATAGAGHPFLVKEAAQVRVDETAFHLLDRLAQGSIGQLLARLPPRKFPPLEDACHPDLQTIPVTGTFIQASVRWQHGKGSWSDSFVALTTIGADKAGYRGPPITRSPVRH